MVQYSNAILNPNSPTIQNPTKIAAILYTYVLVQTIAIAIVQTIIILNHSKSEHQHGWYLNVFGI